VKYKLEKRTREDGRPVNPTLTPKKGCVYEKEPDRKSSQSFCFIGRPFMLQKVLRKEDSRLF